jgi:quaternary ammonium compound-resistance protein SugE
MPWVYLVLAGLFEIGWAVGLKFTEGLTKLWPSVITAFFMIISVTLLSFSLKTLPVGTAYSIWTGIGAVGTVIFGIYLFDEPATATKFFCISLILIGIVGLKIIHE